METKNSVEVLAERLEHDIRERGLTSGQRYLIAKDASVLFDENIITVHRAMKMLADRKVLVRQRRKGTFVGPDFQNKSGSPSPTISCMHVVMAMAYYQTSGMPANALIEGIKSVLPLIPIQVHYLPSNDALAYTKSVVEMIKARGTQEGLLLIHSSREMQEYVVSSGSLAAVFGCVYPGVTGLPWVDVDQEQSGELMAQYALDAGHKKFALLMRSDWRRGDNLLHSGITGCLGDAGLSMNSLVTLSVPVDIDIIASEIRDLLESPDAPTVIFCRGDYYADVVVDVAKSLGLKIGKDIEIISGGHLREDCNKDYASIVPKLSNKQQVHVAVKKLCEIARGEKQEADHLIVPAMICNKNTSKQ
ncbi:MAG: GntR family transcriptional regulator [Phycisphaerae bacterium]|nr:GntR family transcriptional regulator [Phycisphaerae bacterium]